jgi:mono/diheme cytochrome c family protein
MGPSASISESTCLRHLPTGFTSRWCAGSRTDAVELLSAAGTFRASTTAFVSVYVIVLDETVRPSSTLFIGLGWAIGASMQIAAGIIARVRRGSAFEPWLPEGRTMRNLLCLSAVLSFLAGAGTAVAQSVENGQLLSERWCLPCHAVSRAQGKADKPRSLESIANTENVNFDKIAAFLRLPHAVMPNLPLSRKEVDDIAAYIARMKKQWPPTDDARLVARRGVRRHMSNPDLAQSHRLGFRQHQEKDGNRPGDIRRWRNGNQACDAFTDHRRNYRFLVRWWGVDRRNTEACGSSFARPAENRSLASELPFRTWHAPHEFHPSIAQDGALTGNVSRLVDLDQTNCAFRQYPWH